MRTRKSWGLFPALLLSFALGACGGGGGGAGFVGDGGDGGTGGGGAVPSANSLSLTLPDGTELPADADTVAEGVDVVVIARDSANRVVAGVPVSFSASSGELVVNQTVTDGTGRASATLTTAGNPMVRDIIVVAVAGSVQDTQSIRVVAPSNTNTAVPRMGVVADDGTFMPGAIAIGQSPLAAGGSSGLRIDIVDTANSNAQFTDPIGITFSSACISSGLARIDPNPATSADGSATATYVALGCSGNDVITARATFSTGPQTAQGTINVEPAALGSIEFVSATPTTIGLRGSGQQETSTVVFRVRNTSGGPAPNQPVSFALNTTVGGLTVSPTSGNTSTDGTIQVVVTSGTVHTSVRVTATATLGGRTVTSQSEALAVTTGIPDQDSFSLSAECFNVEALNRDGTIVPITLRAADRYNNPVPNGTAVAFTTEGGAIVGNCNTMGGACTVNWTSQDPRPAALNGCSNGSDAACAIGGTNGASRAGRSTILAFAIGEESFSDADGDGLRDDSETFNFAFNDLSEAFLDRDEDGVRDSASHVDEIFDFDFDGSFDVADGRFNGLFCDAGGNTSVACPGPRTVHARDSVTVVMSGSSAAINPATIANGGDIQVTGANYNAATQTITVNDNGVFVIRVVVRDVNDQPMPATTTVAFTSAGDAGGVQGTSSYAVPCTIDDRAVANAYGVAFQGADLDIGDANGVGTLELRVTSPGGLIGIFTFTVVTLAPTAPAP